MCDSATAKYRALRADYGLHNRHEESGVITNIKRPVHYCLNETVAEVSISRRFHELELSYGTLWRISHLDLDTYIHINSSSRNN